MSQIIRHNAPLVPARQTTINVNAQSHDIHRLAIPGFTCAADGIDTGAFVTMGFGKDFSGKSAYMLSMPKPMAIIQNDPKTGELLEKDIYERGLDASMIHVSKYLSRVEEVFGTHYTARDKKQMETDEELKKQMESYRKYIEEEKSVAIAAARHPDIVSICIDSGTIMYEDILHAMFGRTSNVLALDKSKAAAELMSLIHILSSQRTRSGRKKHIYITARSVDEFANDKATGNVRAEGCAKLGYLVKVIINFCKIRDGAGISTVMTARPDLLKSGYMPKIDDYYVNIDRSLMTPARAGMNGRATFINDQIQYPNVMQWLYPRVDPMEFYDTVG